MNLYMTNYPSCSLLITTYNWPEALESTLRSVFHQSVFLNEIIFYDDGPKSRKSDMIDFLNRLRPVRLVHVWQEDNR